jgi:hypothetical protein
MFGGAADEFEDEEVLDPAYRAAPAPAQTGSGPSRAAEYFASSTSSAASLQPQLQQHLRQREQQLQQQQQEANARMLAAASSASSLPVASPFSPPVRPPAAQAVKVTHAAIAEAIKLPAPIASTVLPVNAKGAGVFSHGESAFDDED